MKPDQISRLQSGHPLRVLDLFSGCGGISLGFQREGCSIVGGLDRDPEAARSHALNFHSNSARFDAHARARDLTVEDPSAVLREWGETDSVDIIVGGPPCQAFTRIGRAKLRSLKGDDAHNTDPRANLYERYLEWVRQLQPLALVMENVPDMLNFGGRNVAEQVCRELEELGLGYTARYALLNAVHYGVPQARERCLIVALRKDLNTIPELPRPTHSYVLPRGYEHSRRVAMKIVSPESQYHAPPGAPPPEERLAAVTAHEAIGDLPRLVDHLEPDGRAPGSSYRDGCRYPVGVRLSAYARCMRSWKGAPDRLVDHFSRRLQRDYFTFARMECGMEYPAALRVAEARFAEWLAALAKHGDVIQENSERWRLERRNFVPPYDPKKFANKWWKLRPDAPSRTLTAHIGKDTYSHIHYDPEQARTITVREAARLQSFPDGFVFAGKMNAAFRQIGNSVPPLLAAAVAAQLKADLQKAMKGNSFLDVSVA